MCRVKSNCCTSYSQFNLAFSRRMRIYCVTFFMYFSPLRLNGTIVGGRSLSASLLHRSSSSPSISENEDARCKTALQISNYLTELKMQPRGKKVDWKELHVHMADLQMLHEGIMHLEDLPSIVDTSDN